MICGTELDLLQSSGEFPCAVCRTGVGSNSIFCKGCKHWVHKKCSGLKCLTEDPDYRCTGCKGIARPLDIRPQREVQVGPDKLEVVASFCYLGDMLSAASGCELSTTTHVKNAWKKFKELKPVLSSRHLSFKTRGRVYSTCVRSTMLHASGTWPVTKPCLQRLQRNDRAMIRQSEEWIRRLLTWKEAMEEKGLRVNAGRTKIMICGTGLDLLQSSGEFPCAVCYTEWAVTASSAKAVSTGCIRSAVGSSA